VIRKSVVSLSVAAAFAVPTLATAQQAAAPAGPAVPTLDKVLEASGLAVTGYIDTAYTYATKNIEAGVAGSGIAPRVFDNQNNSFALHQFGLQVAKQPKEGVGGLVNLTVGKDAQVIHSFPEAGGSSMFDVTQAFLQYATGPFTIMAGKFTTLQGTEVIWSPSNVNFSRSLLFGAVPFTHTGVRGAFSLGDMGTLYAGVNNGWDQVTDANRSKTLELGATLTPIKPLSITVSDYHGQEPTVLGNGSRNSFDAVASWTIMEPLSVGVEYLAVTQDNFSAATSKAKYDGFAGYVTWTFMPKLRASLRLEQLKDKDGGFHFGIADTKYKEGTLTISYLHSDSLELRGEVRHDSSDKNVYLDFSGPGMSKSYGTFALQALYKF